MKELILNFSWETFLALSPSEMFFFVVLFVSGVSVAFSAACLAVILVVEWLRWVSRPLRPDSWTKKRLQ